MNSSNDNLSFQQKIFQRQQELQDKQNRENLANFLRVSGENVNSLNEQGSLNNDYISGPHFLNRRRSYGPIASSPLRPVHESRSSSPTFQFQIQSLCANKATTQNDNSFQQISNQKIPKANSSFNLKSNARQFRTGSLGSIGSFEAGQNSGLSSVLSNFSNLKFSDSNLEEKLATTGNIFQQRENWSIINKLPIDKQNTIHIRLEDEGPYGNDETRCFVLSHLSKLGIKELNCVFCNCLMPVYDRTGALPYFSLYSEKTKCPHCFSEDYHFIKQLNKIFLEKKCDQIRKD